MAKIKVTADKGRTVPVDPSLGSAPGRRTLFLLEGDVLEVEEQHSGVQRALRDGDFVRVVEAPTAETSAPSAATSTPAATPAKER